MGKKSEINKGNFQALDEKTNDWQTVEITADRDNDTITLSGKEHAVGKLSEIKINDEMDIPSGLYVSNEEKVFSLAIGGNDNQTILLKCSSSMFDTWSSIFIGNQRDKLRKGQKSSRFSETTGTILCLLGWSQFYEYVLFFSLLWITIIGALKLDGSVSWEWYLILIPVYIAVVPIIINPFTRLLAGGSYVYTSENDDEFDGSKLCMPWIFTMACLYPLYSNQGYWVVSAIGCTIGMWIILFAVKLASASASLGWLIVFIPLWCCLLVMLALIVTLKPKQRKYGSVFGIAIVLLTVFLLLLGLQLDHHIDISWQAVMAPAYILDAVIIFGGIALQLAFVKSGSDKAFLGWCGYVFAVILVVLLLTFEILIARKLDEEIQISFMSAFAPLVVLEGLVLGFYVILACLMAVVGA